MERTPLFQQSVGALLLSGIFAVTLLTQAQADNSQGTLGNTSSGSFTITLKIPPSARTEVTTVDESATDEEGNPVIIPTDTLSFDRPVSLCVSGRGFSRFSLASDGVSGVSLTVAEPGRDTRITGNSSAAFNVENDCRNSTRKLIAQPEAGFQGSKQPAVVVIQAE